MEKYNHCHLLGIGGIGMSGIAKLLLRRGIKISGSDLKENSFIDELRRLGAEIFVGHSPFNLKGADLVIYSSAIKEDNPEFIQARRLGIPLLKRAEALAKLMENKIVITVAGSHGKTTTSSLVSYLLLQAKLNPTLAVGGIFRNIDTNAYLGDGKFFVAEADESDGSFLHYQPAYSIILNIDYEHLDFYKDFKTEVDTFKMFLAKTRSDGCVLACYDDLNLKNMAKDYKGRRVLFGLNEDADIHPKKIKISGLSSDFDCFYQGRRIDRFHLALGGAHNISNALSVIALGLELKIDLPVIKNTLENYKGCGRRLEIKFNNSDYLIIDDYAHHPTEIKASLAAVKNINSKRVIAVFQPHRFSRTKLLLDEFSSCFDLADYVIITDIYSANEPFMEGITGRLVHDKIKKNFPGKNVQFVPKQEIIGHVMDIKKTGDLIVTLGAGDITRICDELVEEFKGSIQNKRAAEGAYNL